MRIWVFASIVCLTSTGSLAKKSGRFDTEDNPTFCVERLSEKDLIDTLEEARGSGCIDDEEYIFLKSHRFTPICALKRESGKAVLMMYCR